MFIHLSILSSLIVNLIVNLSARLLICIVFKCCSTLVHCFPCLIIMIIVVSHVFTLFLQANYPPLGMEDYLQRSYSTISQCLYVQKEYFLTFCFSLILKTAYEPQNTFRKSIFHAYFCLGQAKQLLDPFQIYSLEGWFI